MSIRYLENCAALEGVVTVEDAEGLMQWLRGQATPTVHLGRCEHLHAAALQVLLALKPHVVQAPADRWLAAAVGGGTV